MSAALMILGNQLFPISYVKKINPDIIFMFEDLGLCEHFKYHKHKIIFFLSAMRHYKEELQKQGFKVYYVSANQAEFDLTYEQKLDLFLKSNPKVTSVHYFEIEDKFFEKRIQKYLKSNQLEFKEHNSPLFLCSRENFKEYLSQVKKPFMKTFYERERKRLNILVDKNNKPEGGTWSYDSENRKKLPDSVDIPEFNPAVPDELTAEIMMTVEALFPEHPGDAENFWIPVTREDSLRVLDQFIDEKLKNFGEYQDAITPKSDFVFHSIISPMLNVGLLTPDEVCQKVVLAYKKNPQKNSLNSVEGFVRQVIGWREFIRGVYQNFDEKQQTLNFWGHQRKLNKKWYQGTTSIPVLDDAIKKAQKWGYNHHIERLMIVSNMMLLSEIHPQEVYKWFMEMFVDSSDWVMGPNVFGMGQFSDGGIFATKPYICGSNYYLKMSSYKKGDWCDVVDGLYWRFIDKHKDFYESNPRMGMMVKILDKMDKAKKKRIFSLAENFIESVSSLNN